MAVLILVAATAAYAPRLMAPERRSAFREAQAAIDTDHPGRASWLLEALSKTHPNSLLLKIYLAAAYADSKDGIRAQETYSLFQTTSDSEILAECRKVAGSCASPGSPGTVVG